MSVNRANASVHSSLAPMSVNRTSASHAPQLVPESVPHAPHPAPQSVHQSVSHFHVEGSSISHLGEDEEQKRPES